MRQGHHGSSGAPSSCYNRMNTILITNIQTKDNNHHKNHSTSTSTRRPALSTESLQGKDVHATTVMLLRFVTVTVMLTSLRESFTEGGRGERNDEVRGRERNRQRSTSAEYNK